MSETNVFEILARIDADGTPFENKIDSFVRKLELGLGKALQGAGRMAEVADHALEGMTKKADVAGVALGEIAEQLGEAVAEGAEKAGETLEGMATAVEAAVGEAGGAIEEMAQALEGSQEGIEDAAGGMDALAEAGEELADGQETLRDFIGQTEEELRKKLAAMEALLPTLKDGSRDYKALSEQIERTKEQLGEASPKANGFGSALIGLGGPISTVMRGVGRATGIVLGWMRTLMKWAAVAGAAVTGAGAYFLKTASDYESAFAMVRKVVDGTEEDYTRLNQALRAMAAETSHSFEDLATIMAKGGRSGVRGVENLISYTRVVADMSVAAEMTAEAAADALNEFRLNTSGGIENVDRLASVVVRLGNETAASEDKLLSMAIRIGGAGTVAGISQEQILALAAGLTSVGIRSEMGGTAMSKLIITMAGLTEGSAEGNERMAEARKKLLKVEADLQLQLKRSREDLDRMVRSGQGYSTQAVQMQRRIEDLGRALNYNRQETIALEEAARSGGSELALMAKVIGVNAEELKAMFKSDPAGTVGKLFEGFERLRISGGNLFGVLQQLGFDDARMIQMLLSGSLATEEFARASQLAADEIIENTALTKEAAIFYGTLANVVRRLWTNVRNLAAAAGEPFLEPLKEFIKGQLIPALAAGAAWVQANEERLKAWGGEALRFLIDVFERTMAWIANNQDKIQTFLDRVGNLLAAVWEWINKILAWFDDQESVGGVMTFLNATSNILQVIGAALEAVLGTLGEIVVIVGTLDIKKLAMLPLSAAGRIAGAWKKIFGVMFDGEEEAPGYSKGGLVPGPRGAGDIVKARLSPGEAVITAPVVRRNWALIQRLLSGAGGAQPAELATAAMESVGLDASGEGGEQEGEGARRKFGMGRMRKRGSEESGEAAAEAKGGVHIGEMSNHFHAVDPASLSEQQLRHLYARQARALAAVSG